MLGSSVRYAQIDTTTTGDQTVVAAVSGKRILVCALVLNPAAETDITFKSGSTEVVDFGGFRGTDEPPGLGLSFNPHGYFETAAGQALVMNVNGAVAVRGLVNYILR
jgi:hypothetical protein